MGDVWLSWSLDQLLWATRGRSWGFRILTLAKATGLDSLSLYEAVFAARGASASALEDEPQFFCADVVDAAGSGCCVMAARFLDPDTERRDESGRRIPHEILLVAKKNAIPDPHTAPADWHLQLFQCLDPVYRELYSLQSSDRAIVPPESIKPSEIVREGSSRTADWIDLGAIPFAKPTRGRVKSRNAITGASRDRLRPTWLFVVMAAIFALVITVGVLAAMKSHGRRKQLVPEPKPQQGTSQPIRESGRNHRQGWEATTAR